MARDEWLDLSDLVERAQDLLEVGLVDDAQALLDDYAPMYQDSWELHFMYARVAAEREEHALAVDLLRKSLRLGGHNADTYLGLFYANTELGRMPKGARYLLRAFERFPGNELVCTALIWYYVETRRFRDALSVFKKARAAGLEHPDMFRNAGMAFQHIGDFESAESCFREAIARAPMATELSDLLADMFVANEQTQRAIDVYQNMLERSPDNIHALSRLVFMYGHNGDTAKAEETATRIVNRYPNSPVGYVDLAYVHLNQDRHDQALEHVERALQVAPLEPEAFRARAVVHSERDEDKLAEESFRHAIALAPKNAEILRDYYHHLRKVGELERMESTVREVIRLERPHCIDDYWFLADYYWEKGHLAKSFECLSQAHKSMPGDRDLLPPLISILLDRKHESYALPHLISYASRAGWDTTMSEFARHRRLASRKARESMRFLRFYTQRFEHVRSHEYRYFVTRWLRYAALLLALPIGVLFASAGNYAGALYAVAACVLMAALAHVAHYLVVGPPMFILNMMKHDAPPP